MVFLFPSTARLRRERPNAIVNLNFTDEVFYFSGPSSLRLTIYRLFLSPLGSLYLRTFVASGFGAAIGGTGGGESGFLLGSSFISFTGDANQHPS